METGLKLVECVQMDANICIYVYIYLSTYIQMYMVILVEYTFSDNTFRQNVFFNSHTHIYLSICMHIDR